MKTLSYNLKSAIMASIRDVAVEAKVSLGTVSKVLNRTNASISPATRERVFDAAKRVGYHPSAVARGLAGKRMNSVGVIIAYDQFSVTSDPYLGPCLDGILEVNKRARQKTVVFAEDSWAEARTHLPAYCDGHCDGLMLVIPRLDSEIITDLRLRSVPFVLVGDSRVDTDLVAIDVNNVAAAQEVTAYLIGLGHRRIAVFCGYPDFQSNHQRIDGYRRALEAASIGYDPNLIFDGQYRQQSGYENMQGMLTRFPTVQRPTAVFCLSDGIALGAMVAATDAGLGIPRDLSIVGFDDVFAASTAVPPLTTVRQSVRDVGSRATEILLALLDAKITPGHREYLPHEIVVRASTAPPPIVHRVTVSRNINP